MRSIFISAILTLFLAAFAAGQSITFNDPNVGYTFELPEATWKMISKPSATSPNVEYIYGDRLDGALEIRKTSIKADELLSDVILRETEQKLQFLPGFVAGKESDFAGKLKGRVLNFEYVKAGKNMSGRYYFLRAEGDDVYVLRFSGLRDKMLTIRNQTDSIARTFKLK